MSPLPRLLGRSYLGQPLALLGRRPGWPPRVVELVGSLDGGAVPSLVAGLCSELPARELPCFCICLEPPGERAVASLPEPALISLAGDRRPPPRRSLAIAGALRRLRADLLHTHGATYADGLAAALLARVPILVHSELAGQQASGSRLLRAGSLLTSRFVVSSRAEATRLGKRIDIPAERIRVVPPSVDDRRFRPGLDRERTRERLGVSGEEILVGSVGRLDASRNYAVLLEAVSLMRDAGSSARCLLVGHGLESDTLSHQARQLGIADKLHITGFTREVPTLLAAMDIFVLPSASDHVPQSLLEAMAVGLPVVVGSGGPIAEVVRDGENGLLVPADRPRILARILGQLGDSPSRRAALGERARRAVEQHHRQERVVEELADLYRALTARPPAGRQAF